MERTDFAVASTTREPSKSIWFDCPVMLMLDDPSTGNYWFDDFMDLPLQPTLTTQIAYGRYKAYATASCTLKSVSTVSSTEQGGGYLEKTAAADNDGISIAQAYPTFMLSGNVSDSGKLWFEARIAISTIATNTTGFFLGLAETDLLTLSATVPFNAASGSTSNAGGMIGFFKDEDGLGVINTVKADRATSFSNIGASEASIAALSAASGVVSGFTKLGMVYDPKRSTDCIRFYQDGTQLTTVVSKTTLQAYTHIDANALGLMFASIYDSGASSSTKTYLQWWRCAQMNPGESW